MFSPELNCPPPDLEELVQLNRMLPQCLAHEGGCLFLNSREMIWPRCLEELSILYWKKTALFSGLLGKASGALSAILNFLLHSVIMEGSPRLVLGTRKTDLCFWIQDGPYPTLLRTPSFLSSSLLNTFRVPSCPQKPSLKAKAKANATESTEPWSSLPFVVQPPCAIL